MTDDRLRLTVEEIEAQGDRVTAPPILTIQPEDVPEHAPPQPTGPRHLLQITADDVAAFEPAGPEVVGALEQLVMRLINEARGENMPKWLGREALRWHPALATAARRHAADMLERRYVAHSSPEGLTVAQRLDRDGILTTDLDFKVYDDGTTIEQINDGWLAVSQARRAYRSFTIRV